MALTVVFLFLAVGVGLTLVRALVLAKRHGDWDSSATFIVLVGWALNGAMALAALTGARAIYTDNLTNETTILTAGWVTTLNALASRGLILIGLALAVHGLARRRVHFSGKAVLALALAGLSAMVSAFSGYGLFATSLLALVACLGAALVLPRGRGAMLGAGFVAVTIGILSAALVALRPEMAMFPCSDKCGPFGVLIVGVPGNENALGLLLAMCVPFAWLGFRGAPRVWLSLFLVFMTVASGSRTASIAALAALAALLLLRPDLERPAGRGRAFLGSLLGLGGVAAAVVVPLTLEDPLAFTGRVYLWDVAFSYIAEHPWFGNGLGAWQRLYTDRGEIVRAATYSAHNQWIDVLFLAGGLGLALFVALLASFFLPRTPHRRVLAWTILMPMIYAGIAERLWSIGSMDWLSFGYLAALMSMPAVLPSEDSAFAEGEDRAEADGDRPDPHLIHAP